MMFFFLIYQKMYGRCYKVKINHKKRPNLYEIDIIENYKQYKL